jgi:hypothetical protein
MEHRGPGVEAQLRVRLELGIVPAPFRVPPGLDHVLAEDSTETGVCQHPLPGVAGHAAVRQRDLELKDGSARAQPAPSLRPGRTRSRCVATPAYGALLGDPAELRTDRPRELRRPAELSAHPLEARTNRTILAALPLLAELDCDVAVTPGVDRPCSGHVVVWPEDVRPVVRAVHEHGVQLRVVHAGRPVADVLPPLAGRAA